MPLTGLRGAATLTGPDVGTLPSLDDRVSRRLMPILFPSDIAAYLDRVNVGFAKLQMLTDLRISDAAWLSAPEKTQLAAALEGEAAARRPWRSGPSSPARASGSAARSSSAS